MLETFRIKGPFNDWVKKVLKGHTRSIRRVYRFKEVDRVSSLEMDRRTNNKSLKEKSKIPRSLKEKMSRNELNKGIKDRGKFGYKIPNNYREVFLIGKKNVKNLWADKISKEMTALEKLCVFQFICLKPGLIRRIVGNTRQ